MSFLRKRQETAPEPPATRTPWPKGECVVCDFDGRIVVIDPDGYSRAYACRCEAGQRRNRSGFEFVRLDVYQARKAETEGGPND